MPATESDYDRWRAYSIGFGLPPNTRREQLFAVLWRDGLTLAMPIGTTIDGKSLILITNWFDNRFPSRTVTGNISLISGAIDVGITQQTKPGSDFSFPYGFEELTEIPPGWEDFWPEWAGPPEL